MELKELLEKSRNENKGITLYVNGITIGALVTNVGEEFVEGKSREFGRIVIRLDRIDGAAML